MKQLSKRILVWGIVGIAVLLLATIGGLPFALKWYAQEWLLAHGSSSAQIEEVDLNLFTGRIGFAGFAAQNQEGDRLEVEILEIEANWRALLDRRIDFTTMHLRGGHLDIKYVGRFHIGPLRFDPPATATSLTPAPGWGFGLRHLELSGITVAYSSEVLERQLTVERATISGLVSWLPEQPARVAARIHTEAGNLEVSGQVTPYADRVKFTGSIKTSALQLHPYLGQLADFGLQGVEDFAGSLTSQLSVTAEFVPKAELAIELDGEVRMQENLIASAEVRLSCDDARWQGRASVQFDLSDGGRPVVFESKSNLSVNTLAFERGAEALRVLELGTGEITGISITSDELIIDEVAVTDLTVRLERNAEGVLRIPGLISGGIELAEDAAEKNVSFSIGRVILSGESHALFRDDSIEPAFSAQLDIEALELIGIDSSATEPLTVRLQASQGDTAKLAVEGSISPFAQALSADLHVELKGFDISQLSGYVPGYHLERGQLTMTSYHRIDEGNLELNNHVILDKLKLALASESESAWVAEGLSMPLDVMLDLLRDRNDQIEVELPITGSLDDPEFGTGDLLRLATQAALQKAALSYVKSALQPLGTILFAADLIGKATRPRFKPIEFVPGVIDLTDEQIAYIDKLDALLDKRPRLRLTFCGFATGADEAALLAVETQAVTALTPEEPIEPVISDSQLLNLAKGRADAIKSSLLVSGTIDAERLYDCRPSIEPSVDALPRVEITL